MDEPSERILKGKDRQVRVQALAENAVRISLGKAGEEWSADRPWLAHVLVEQAAQEMNDCELRVAIDGRRVQISTEGGGSLLAEKAAAEIEPSGVRMCFQMGAEEAFFGGGEWFNGFMRREASLRLHVQESPSLLQNKRTYSTIPFFLSTRGFGFFLLNSHESRWQFNPQAGEWTIEVDGPPADFILIHGPDFRRIVETYTALTGRPPLPPLWAFGLWVTSYPQDHQEAVLAHVAEHRRREVPLDAVILDYHWEERFHNFRWRNELIPDQKRLVAGLRAANVRLGLILTPFVNRRNQFLKNIVLQLLVRDIPRGMVFSDERALPEYEEAQQKGLLAHEDATWWFGRGGMLDFSNPAAADWWNAKLRPLYDLGVDFFKNDDGEYLPEDAAGFLGMDGREYHNLYGFFYGRAMYEGMAALDDRRAVIYARSVWAGSQRYPAVFLGDQKPSFECIRRTLRAGMNLGLAGFAYWTADVFGLDGKTTPETHMRYGQWALLNPVARYFWRPPRIDNTRFPWSHGSQVEANFKTYARLRYQLLPTYYALAWEAMQTGVPILRPLVMAFPEEPELAGVEDQVMLGENLMLAPVVEKGAVQRKILLPGGRWYDFWSQAQWEGPGEIVYEAPVERLPLLVKGGTLLVMGPPLEHIPDDHRFDCLELHCWPPYPADSVLYEDDGVTRGYEHGTAARSRLRVVPEAGQVRVELLPAVGSFEGQPLQRVVYVVLHDMDRPRDVQVSDGVIADPQYDAEKRELSVLLEGVPVRTETRVVVVH